MSRRAEDGAEGRADGMTAAPPRTARASSAWKVGALLAIALGAFTLMMLATDVVPRCREAHGRMCRILIGATLAVATLAAALRGVARARGRAEPGPRWKRLCARLAFWLLLPVGAELLATGHSHYIKAKRIEMDRQAILERDGVYRNPHWDYQALCDCLGLASFAGWGLWVWLELVSQGVRHLATFRSSRRGE